MRLLSILNHDFFPTLLCHSPSLFPFIISIHSAITAIPLPPLLGLLSLPSSSRYNNYITCHSRELIKVRTCGWYYYKAPNWRDGPVPIHYNLIKSNQIECTIISSSSCKPLTHAHPTITSTTTSISISYLPQNSSTSEKTLLQTVPRDPSEMICSTGKLQSWDQMIHHTLAEYSSSTSISLLIIHSSLPRYTSPPASTTATLIQMEESVLISSRISGVLHWPLARCYWASAPSWLTPILMIHSCQILHSYSRVIDRGMIAQLESGPASMPCNGMECTGMWSSVV